ncbi:MAG: hypothetical protein JWN00_3318 [Actinomycetia bacterium]|nr:hypothetical protein [Actinomycetes bacterium]
MANDTPAPVPSDEDAVLSLQETESDQEDVQAHSGFISTVSLIASC